MDKKDLLRSIAAADGEIIMVNIGEGRKTVKVWSSISDFFRLGIYIALLASTNDRISDALDVFLEGIMNGYDQARKELFIKHNIS